jgi:hypothetical protein
MKKLLSFAPLLLLLALPALAHAATTFVPLAPIPGLTQNVDPNNLAVFFNGLYKFCIGAAAVLAILEITMGGFQVMSGDSVTAHSAGRERIMGAVLGLILVLSPFLVFSIINPCILSFSTTANCPNSLSSDFSSLQPSNTSPGSGSGTAGSADQSQSTGSNTNADSGGSSAPNAPTNLQTTSQTSTSVALSWTAPSGGTPPAKYNIYDSGKLVGSIGGTAVNIPNLAPNSSHVYTVTAVDTSGKESVPSVGLELVTVDGSTGQDGSQGSVAYEVWDYRTHQNENDHDTTCWSYGLNSYPVPYQGQNADQMQAKCQAALQSDPAQQDPGSVFYPCKLYQPGQTPAKPAQPASPAAPLCQ